MTSPNLNQIAEALNPSGLPQRFTPDVSRLIIALLRLIVEGRPVPLNQVEQIAVEQGVSSEVANSVIRQMCERDRDGSIVGLMGLSQNHHAHAFHVNGRRLATWCAWDALFLPSLLRMTAEVESRCPATREKIRLTVTPERVETYSPPSTTLSIIIPQTKAASVGEIWMAFCNHIHFFKTREAAAEWFATRPQKVYFLSPEEGFQLGQMQCGTMLTYAER